MGVTTGRRKSKRVSTARSKLHIASLVAMDDRDSDDDSEFPAAIPIPDEDDEVSESGDDDKAECEEDDDNEDDDDEEGAGSQESQGDDSSVVEKRKRACSVDTEDVLEIDSDTEEEVPAPKKTKKNPVTITYTASFLAPLEKGKKAPASRTPMKTDLIYMTNDEPFDTLKAQILVRIAAVYAPDKLNFDDYNVSFTVPRLVKDAIGLDAQSYTHLLKNAQKMDDPAVKILIDPKPDRLPTCNN
ncbi:hypothetical protein C8F04DRAFT_1153209 [Mycena alexandri]|uniref:Uncharacterized protein n=1 Tax=Mycena alexandri TaxID=1745969 RepID=A0AAD6S356_9AGAR|nr:hypothetical protein C8F04DRAFT_1153209 [Mycena alexandri]